MTTSRLIGWILSLWMFSGLIQAKAQSSSDLTLQLSASVHANPPKITLHWATVESATGYSVSRKARDDITWGEAVTLPANATEFIDATVTIGNVYEYHVWRTGPDYNSHGYIYGGIEVPLVETRGKVILIVENTYASSLGAELAVLEQDLVGDGWMVVRHNVPRMAPDPAELDSTVGMVRSNQVTAVKRLIQADYVADPTHVRTVFLFGHVPVPYSGLLAPDQHADHYGAWPADAFYGDMEGTWTDVFVRSTAALDPRNRNLPGDGKFDQSTIPGRVALELGRVDMANLHAFPSTELELLRQYLFKNHNFRHRLISVQPRALIQDNLGILNREVPAANGWGNFGPLLGPTNVSAGRWLAVLPRDDHLWAYGCGPGTFTRAAGVAETSHFLVYDIKVVFTMLFGSYFGDWDSDDNFLRAPLAMSTHTLAAAWAGRPNWYFHPMALGETIGFSARLSQNNSGLYQEPLRMNGGLVGLPGVDSLKGVHIALMGDPTLRQQPVSPPLSLVVLPNRFGGADLSWIASTDAVIGYHVYRAFAQGGPYTRLNSSLIDGTFYRDSAITSDRYYMVRAVKLETSSSGTYFNASQGTFAEVLRTPAFIESNVWGGGATGTWKINDARGTAGSNPGWDLVKIEGNLNVTATLSNRFTVRMVSFQSDNSRGVPANFNPNTQYSWPILTASIAISGFDPSKIHLMTREFDGDLGGGVFTLQLSDDEKSIHLVFTPNHPPVTQPAVFTRGWDAPLRIAIRDLLEQFTSDSDGDARALLQVGASPNGTLVSSDSTYLLFAPSNNLPETIHYWVQDVRPYRTGDSVRIAMGSFTIDPNPSPLQFRAYHAIEIEWQGEPGKLYQVQSRRQNETDWTNEGDPFVGTGEKKSIFERTSGETKFYRIVLLDITE